MIHIATTGGTMSQRICRIFMNADGYVRLHSERWSQPHIYYATPASLRRLSTVLYRMLSTNQLVGTMDPAHAGFELRRRDDKI